MNILPILYHLQAAFAGSRQVGHTKFARGIAKVGGVLICADEQSAALFARKHDADDTPPQTVSMQDTRAVSRYEAKGVPIVLDNYAVMKLCAEAIHEIQEQRELLKMSEQMRNQEKVLYAQEMQGLHTTLSRKHQENNDLRDTIRAGRIQVQGFEQEVLSLKIQLDAAKAANVVRHIRVTRPTKKRRR